jgi:hypothetical protein
VVEINIFFMEQSPRSGGRLFELLGHLQQGIVDAQLLEHLPKGGLFSGTPGVGEKSWFALRKT